MEKNKYLNKRVILRFWHYAKGLFAWLLGLFTTPAFAQLSKVNGELSGVTSELRTTAGHVMSIVQVLAGILAIIALITLFVKFQEGDHEAKKKLMMWIGGLVVFFIAISIVKSLFTV